MTVASKFLTARSFAHTRWRLNFRSRARLAAWQRQQLERFIRDILPQASRYRGRTVKALSDLPVMDKSVMMEDFAAGNTRGITLEQALEVGLRAEEGRNFSPMLGDLTIGLSSGTSGNRGVFLASKSERLRWSGIMLARALSRELLGRLLVPWSPRLRIAFFLRANSNLYTTLDSRRVAFSFYDLLDGVDNALERLNEQSPDILVGPPALLCALAEEVRTHRLRIRPRQVISVADVLEDHDADLIIKAFGVIPDQLYQATEGFLGYTCESGGLHLNECFVHVEPEWLDDEHTRFQPIITDFSRDTQLIVRYRLNDVLKVSSDSCPCGRAELALDAIEGRADEVLWFPSSQSGQAVAVYPDQVRRAMILAGHVVQEYEVVQSKMHVQIGLLPDGDKALAIQCVSDELNKLWTAMGVTRPSIGFSSWQPPEVGAKRRRIRIEAIPDGLQCTF